MFSTIDSSRNNILLNIEIPRYLSFRKGVLLHKTKNSFRISSQVWVTLNMRGKRGKRGT